MLNLKEKTAERLAAARAYSELIPWMLQVAPHLVLNKDGSLLACYALEGLDAADVRTEEIDQAANTMENALRVFDERITLWWTVDRRRTRIYPGGSFPDPVSEFVDELWSERFTDGSQFENRHWFAVLYTPSGGVEGFMDRAGQFMREGQGTGAAIVSAVKTYLGMESAFAFDDARLQGEINRFEELLGAFEASTRGLYLRRLVGEKVLRFLHDRASPAAAGQPVAEPNVTEFLDAWIADNTLQVGSDTLLFDGTASVFAAAATVKSWPAFTSPGLLDALLALPSELTLSLCFRYVELQAAKKYIEEVRKNNLNSSKSMLTYLQEALSGKPSDKVDQGKLAGAQDANEALLSIATARRFFGYFNMTVLAYGRSREETEEGMRLVTQAINTLGFLTLRERLHLLSAWAGTLPGQWGELVRWFFLSSANLSDLAPIRTIATGEAENAHLTEQTGRRSPALTALPTEWGVPFLFNLHQADKAHTLVVGPTRAGKSVFMNFLIMQFRKYHPCRVFIFDKDYSCRIPALLMGGTHVDMSGDETRVQINPLSLLSDRNNWLWVAKWLELLLAGRGQPISASDSESIWDAVENTAHLPREKWRLLSLAQFLGARSKELGEELGEWVGNGARARYFDHVQDTFALTGLTCTEVGKLFEDELVAPLFLEYAFQRIRMTLDGTPTLIYVEECWYMLMYERFAARLDDWLRTLGKKNAFVVLTTQGLLELARSAYFGTILDNIANTIFLPNPKAFAHEKLYVGKFGLHPESLARIRDATPKMHYYIVTPERSRMAVVTFPPQVLACVRSDSRAQKVFLKHYATKDVNEDWKERYVNEVMTGNPDIAAPTA